MPLMPDKDKYNPENLGRQLPRALPRIGDVRVACPACGWGGVVDECEPDVDGDGSLGCPKCGTVVEQPKS